MDVLKKGSKGAQVVQLQNQLIALGYNLKADGDFGDNTDKAVRAAQTRFNLVADGIVGVKTWTYLTAPVKTLTGLTEEDYQWAADYLQDDVPSVKAVRGVEAPAGGFLVDGRATILFERHVMYRQLKANGFNPDDYLADPNIVNKTPGGYLGKAAEYDRLAKASKIDETSALESCSWGAYQIMGYHWKLLGFNSVRDYVAANQASELGQLQCFVKFIKANPALLKAIREDDWATFAKNYNGPDYKKNNYDVKLAEAFKKFGGK